MTAVTPSRVDAMASVLVPTGVVRNLAFVGNRNFNATTVGTQVATIPSVVLAGDLALMFIACRTTQEVVANQTALGWTLIDSQVSAGTGSVEGYVYRQTVTATQASTLNISYDGVRDATTSGPKRAAFVYLRGHDIVNQSIQSYKRTSADGANPTVVEGVNAGMDRPGMCALSFFIAGGSPTAWTGGAATATNLRSSAGSPSAYLQYQFPDGNLPTPTILDYFRGPIDTNVWTVVPDNVSRPNFNGEVSQWVNDSTHVYTSSDGLHLKATKTDLTHWPSGRIENSGRAALRWQSPVLLECRTKSPNQVSYWGSVWSEADDVSNAGWAGIGEEDWTEEIGNGNDHQTIHVSNPPNTAGAAAHVQFPLTAAYSEGGWHVHKTIINHTHRISYLDGVQIGRTDDWPGAPGPFSQHNYDTRIQLAIGSTNWNLVPLPTSSTPSGLEYQVDYVRVQPLPRVNSGTPQIDAVGEEIAFDLLIPSAFTQTASNPNPVTVQVRTTVGPSLPGIATGPITPGRVNVVATVPFLGVDNTLPVNRVDTRATVFLPTITHKLDQNVTALRVGVDAAVPPAVVSGTSTITPTRVDTTSTVPTPAITNTPQLQPLTIAIEASVPDPLVNVGTEQITVAQEQRLAVNATVPLPNAIGSPTVTPDAVGITSLLLNPEVVVVNPTGLFQTSFHRHHAQLEAKAHGHAWIEWRPL